MAGQPIYLDKRNPWERMLPQMLQLFMASKMQGNRLTAAGQEAQKQRQYAQGVRGQDLDVRMQEQGRYQYTDQWASKGVEGGVKNPITGKVYGGAPTTSKPWKLTDQGLIYTKGNQILVDPKLRKDPASTITTSTNKEGVVTITSTNKKTGKVIYQKSLGKVGRPGTTNIQLSISEKIGQKKTAENIAWVKGPKFAADIEKSVAKRMGDDWEFLGEADKYTVKRKEAEAALAKIYPKKQAKYGFHEDKGWGYKIGTQFVPWESPVIQFMPAGVTKDGGQILRGTFPK